MYSPREIRQARIFAIVVVCLSFLSFAFHSFPASFFPSLIILRYFYLVRNIIDLSGNLARKEVCGCDWEDGGTGTWCVVTR